MYHIIVIVLIIIMGILLLVSRSTTEELDDVHPLIMDVDDPLLQRSDWLWVIPYYANTPISAYPGWVDRIKKTGKKLGLHGVHHTHKEFGVDRTDEYIDKGVNEFKKAFGYYPAYFKAPSLRLTKNNANKLRKRGMKIKSWFNQITHTVHHSPRGRVNGNGSKLLYE